MITVLFQNIAFDNGVVFKSDKNISVSLNGHALFDKKGNDIVCAAVSTLAQTLVRAITVIGNIEQDWEQGKGYLKTDIKLDIIEEKKKF